MLNDLLGFQGRRLQRSCWWPLTLLLSKDSLLGRPSTCDFAFAESGDAELDVQSRALLARSTEAKTAQFVCTEGDPVAYTDEPEARSPEASSW